MKAISIKQPWTWLIATERKAIETRTWSTQYRGDLLICSSKKPTNDISVRKDFQTRFGAWAMMQLRCGVALCIAELVDCRPMVPEDVPAAMCDFNEGAYSWVLAEIRKIEPFEVKGKLGLFKVDYEEVRFEDEQN